MNYWRQYGTVTTALNLIQETKELIKRYNGLDSPELTEAILNIERGSHTQRKEAFRLVQDFSCSRVLSDLYLKDMPGDCSAWDVHLNRLSKACAKAYKKLNEEIIED